MSSRVNEYSDLAQTSPNTLENGNASTVVETQTSRIEPPESTWPDSFTKLDRLLSGGTLQLVYRIIDIIILFIGLLSTKPMCSFSNRLAVIALILAIFYLIDFAIIISNFFQNLSPNYRNLSEEEKQEKYRRTASLRTFLSLIKLIPVCLGASYAFSSSSSSTITPDCELMRFCVGLTCISTLLTMFIPATKPEIPPRRTFLLEALILSFLLIMNGTYLGTVASAIKNIQHPSCIYHTSEDIYLSAPLKSYAYAGIILFSCTTSIHILNLLVSQLCNRIPNGRRLYSYYYAFQYALNYFGGVLVIYYFSIGALFLFKPRSGGECRTMEPSLYRTLLVWQWIRILTPLFIVPLVLVLCCLGLTLGIMLSYCLPAWITVPLLNAIRGWIAASPVQINQNPPASQAKIDAVQVVSFGQEPDPYNQTECAICQTNYEVNESVKKLVCGHLFHAQCVDRWLIDTGICPVCRRRI